MNTSNVFTETAQYYSKYRLDYPEELVDIVMGQVGVKKFDRMLDLGCGTGKVALAFHKCFSEIIAADINAEMVQEAARVSGERGINNIKWLVKPAEEIDESYGKFGLITFGASLHWMDREKVLITCFKMLDKGGVIAVLNFGRGFSREESAWKNAVQDTIEKWVVNDEGNQPNISLGTINEELSQLPFSEIKEANLEYKDIIDVDSIIGYLYSTSYCNKKLLGENIENFERDLKSTLYKLSPENRFEGKLTANYIMAVK